VRAKAAGTGPGADPATAATAAGSLCAAAGSAAAVYIV